MSLTPISYFLHPAELYTSQLTVIDMDETAALLCNEKVQQIIDTRISWPIIEHIASSYKTPSCYFSAGVIALKQRRRLAARSFLLMAYNLGHVHACMIFGCAIYLGDIDGTFAEAEAAAIGTIKSGFGFNGTPERLLAHMYTAQTALYNRQRGEIPVETHVQRLLLASDMLGTT
jgi:hypothetical protein